MSLASIFYVQRWKTLHTQVVPGSSIYATVCHCQRGFWKLSPFKLMFFKSCFESSGMTDTKNRKGGCLVNVLPRCSFAFFLAPVRTQLWLGNILEPYHAASLSHKCISPELHPWLVSQIDWPHPCLVFLMVVLTAAVLNTTCSCLQM